VHWTTYPASNLLTIDAESGTQIDSLASANAGRYLLHGERPLVLRYFKGKGAPDVWDLADPRDGTAVRTLPGPVNGNAFSRDGRFVASTPGTPPLEFHDLAAGTKSVAAIKWSYDDGIARLVTFSPDASHVAFSTDRGRLYVVDRAKGRKVLEAKSGLHGAVTALALTSDGRLLAAGDAFGAIHLWSIEDEQEFPPLTGHRGPVYALEVSPDGTRLVSASADATILVWDVSGFRPSR
jgi:WD40 repeat protein